MITLTLLSLLATVTLTVSQNPSDDCWYGSLCPYNRDSPDQFLIPITEDTMLKKMTWCQDQCLNDPDSKCEHFTQLEVGLPATSWPPVWVPVTMKPVSRMVSVTVVPRIVTLTITVPCWLLPQITR